MNFSYRAALLFSALFILTGLTSTAQKAGGVYDSTYISKKNMQQQNDFWNNTYNFPAKPRNKWELGAAFGVPTVSSDVPAVFPTFGFSAHVRKSIGYLFSIRAQYVNGTAKGLMWQVAGVHPKNPAWIDNVHPLYKGNLPSGKGYVFGYRDATGQIVSSTGGVSQYVYYNYKTNIQDLSIQAIASINNVLFHKSKTKFVLYGGAGIGVTAYHTMINALDANGNNYYPLFSSIYNGNGAASVSYSTRKNVLKALKSGMDNTYETEAENEARSGKMGKSTIKPSGTVIAGVQYQLSKLISLSLEDRHTFVKTDLLDGQQWQVHANGDVVQTRDYDSWNFLSLGVNFSIGGKSVEPLWWLNPLDYAYGEMNNPKHIKFPKTTFEDADGDGVIDQLDREPNTPSGCAVDTHGVARDTDGDGVPDCKDKQLITPTDCQPVDADGVGKCPELECCTTIKEQLEKLGKGGNGEGGNLNCPNDYPSLQMKAVTLSKDNKAMLAAIATKLKDHPECKIQITSYPASNKRAQALAEAKMKLVEQYLIEKLGISSDRISTSTVVEGGDANIIDIKSN